MYEPDYTDSLRADILPSYINSLMHYGIKGMHWGVRRFEDASGHLTDAGKKRYDQSPGRLTDKKQKKAYIKQMTNDMNSHFKSQLSPNAQKVVHIGKNGYPQMGDSWNRAYRQGLVTHKDSVAVNKAAKNTREYMYKKYGPSAWKAHQHSGVLFREIEDFDTITI